MTDDTIPRSDALRAAPAIVGDTLSDAIARFDARIQASASLTDAAARADVDRIIDEMRLARERWKAAEDSKPVRASRTAAPKVPLGRRLSTPLEDIGL